MEWFLIVATLFAGTPDSFDVVAGPMTGAECIEAAEKLPYVQNERVTCEIAE